MMPDIKNDPYGNSPEPDKSTEQAKEDIKQDRKDLVPEKEIDPHHADEAENPPPKGA